MFSRGKHTSLLRYDTIQYSKLGTFTSMQATAWIMRLNQLN
jgi:hypothetical protein